MSKYSLENFSQDHAGATTKKLLGQCPWNTCTFWPLSCLFFLAALGHDLIFLQQPPSFGCVKSLRLRAQCSSCAKCGFPQHVALKKGSWISCVHDDFWVFPLFFWGVKHIALDFSFCLCFRMLLQNGIAVWILLYVDLKITDHRNFSAWWIQFQKPTCWVVFSWCFSNWVDKKHVGQNPAGIFSHAFVGRWLKRITEMLTFKPSIMIVCPSKVKLLVFLEKVPYKFIPWMFLSNSLFFLGQSQPPPRSRSWQRAIQAASKLFLLGQKNLPGPRMQLSCHHQDYIHVWFGGIPI